MFSNNLLDRYKKLFDIFYSLIDYQLSADEFYKNILKKSIDLFNYNYSVFFIKDKRNNIVIKEKINNYKDHDIYIKSDLIRDECFFEKLNQNNKMINILSTPVYFENRTYGYIHFYNLEDYSYNEDDLKLLKYYSKLLSIVFELNPKFINNNDYDFSIIGESKEIKELLETVYKLENSDASVLITGESGTGKELLARLIYQRSKRKNNIFVAINCAAIPDELLENELFGHKKGAYTGAEDNYIGKFGFANKGTIFFDEIGEMNVKLQAKILRVLQFQEYEPVGSNQTYKTDVRIITATNKNISKLIERKLFREDLYYRLSVIPLNIPPLRSRIDDVELLAEYFLKKYAKDNNKDISGFAPGVLQFLKNYNWPGNVRELQNIIERSVLFCNTNLINLDDIKLFNKNDNEKNKKHLSLKDAIYNYKREFLISNLDKNNWNQTVTAELLGIQRTYLSRLIKELNIDKI